MLQVLATMTQTSPCMSLEVALRVVAMLLSTISGDLTSTARSGSGRLPQVMCRVFSSASTTVYNYHQQSVQWGQISWFHHKFRFVCSCDPCSWTYVLTRMWHVHRFLSFAQGWGHPGDVQWPACAVRWLDPTKPLSPPPTREVLWWDTHILPLQELVRSLLHTIHSEPYPLSRFVLLDSETTAEFPSSCCPGRWNCIVTTHGPPPMAGHSSSVIGSTMVVFGGSLGARQMYVTTCLC